MTTIDALTTAQRLALARFIETYLRLRGSMRWRTAFCECTRRGHFYPYATTEETNHLMRLANDFGPLIVANSKRRMCEEPFDSRGAVQMSAQFRAARMTGMLSMLHSDATRPGAAGGSRSRGGTG